MALTRRQFLTLLGGSAAGAVVFQACGVPADELLVQSPIEMPEDMVTGLDNWYATLCRQCPTSEGLVVRVVEGRAKKIEGNVDYPVNRGRHSARCEANLQALYHPDRITGPLIRVGERGSGEFEEISWTDARGRLTYQLQRLAEAGNKSAMVMVTDPLGGHLGMVVDRFVSRFGGRYMPYEPLERTTLRAAMKQVFDQDVMPDFDIENASFILSFGADFLSSWMSPVRYARGYGQFRQGDRERGTLVHVDSRFSMTAANADRWVYVNPGWEGVLALSIAQVIVSEGLGDARAASELTGGDLGSLDAFAPERVAGEISDAVPPEKMASNIRELAREFAGHGRSLAFGGGSAAAHTNGLFNLKAIYSLNYLVGSVGQRGGVIFNPSPALQDIPTSPAVTPFSDWQPLVSEMKQGKVQVLMVRGADPFYGLPDRLGFRDATFDVPFIYSFSGFMDDTTAMADLILPEHNFLEDWGTDVPDPGPGYQMVGFQQPVVMPLFVPTNVAEVFSEELGTSGFADTLLRIAGDLGLELDLPGDSFKKIVEDGGRRLFETGRGSAGLARTNSYPDFQSFWIAALQNGHWRDESAGSADSVPTPPRLEIPGRAKREPGFDGPKGSDTFHLIPFASTSLGDGRGAPLPWLQATPDPVTTATWSTWIEINSTTAERMGIKEGDVIRVTSTRGRSIEALAFPHPGVPFGVVSIPIGQGHRAGGRYAEARGANVLSILSPSIVDETGALAWAGTRVKIEKTGRWVRVPKFENTVPDLPIDEDRQIIQITGHG
jgi:anaerobic selenocysteine-containing dehydrogenase